MKDRVKKINTIPLVFVGCGGCMREVVYQLYEKDMIKEGCFEVLGYVDINKKNEVLVCNKEIIYLGNDDFFKKNDNINLVLTIGDVKSRKNLLNKYLGLKNINLINLFIDSSMKVFDGNIGVGNLISKDCFVSTNVNVGSYNFINHNTIISHDCVIGNNVVLSPRVTLAGNVEIEDDVFIGIGATIKQGIKIHTGATIGAGAVVVEDVKKGMTVVGVPAKQIEYRKRI